MNVLNIPWAFIAFIFTSAISYVLYSLMTPFIDLFAAGAVKYMFQLAFYAFLFVIMFVLPLAVAVSDDASLMVQRIVTGKK